MMRKFSVAILFILTLTVAANAQQVMYTQTFEDTASLFQNYVLSNLDKGIPADLGYDTLASVPWFVYQTGPGSNHAAVATSNYDTAVPADDWFVTPAIRIGKASKLTWESLSLTGGNADTYQVFVSTTEQSVSGCLFNGPAATFTSNDSVAFKLNTLDLATAGYANRVVFIGFRLMTQSGGDKLAIDNIKVTEDSTKFATLNFIVDMSAYIYDSLFNPRTDTVDIAGTFNNFIGEKNILHIVPGTDSTVYKTSIFGFLDGDVLQFKFRINSSWSDTSVEFPYGQPNRIWEIENHAYTYTCFYNENDFDAYGITKNPLIGQVNVFPNPAQSYAYVKVPAGIIRMVMVNLTGSKILESKTRNDNPATLDVQSLTKGTYLLLFYSRQGFVGSKKLIVN
jgi:hypothetical protein